MEDDLDLEAPMLLLEENPAEEMPYRPNQPKKNLRFVELDDAEKLQKASKSDRTHKATLWGVNIIKGELYTMHFDSNLHVFCRNL